MKVETQDIGDVRVLRFQGKMVIGDGDVALREAVEVAAYDRKKKLLIDLGGVTAMDSSGVGELMALRSKAEKDGFELRLLHVEDKVQQVLQMARLIGLFETYDDEEAALASFG